METQQAIKQRLTLSKQQQLINAARQDLNKELNAVREVFQQPSKFELANKAIKKLNEAIEKINIKDRSNNLQIKKIFLYERDYLSAVILYIQSLKKPQLESLIDTVKHSTQISFLGNYEQSIWEECLDFLNSLEDKKYLQKMEEGYLKLFLAKAERLFQNEDKGDWEEARKIMERILSRLPLSPEVIKFFENNCEKVQLFDERVKKIFPPQLAKAFKKQTLKFETEETLAADRDFERLLNFLELLEVLEKLIRGSGHTQKLIQKSQNLITKVCDSLKERSDFSEVSSQFEKPLESLKTLLKSNLIDMPRSEMIQQLNTLVEQVNNIYSYLNISHVSSQSDENFQIFLKHLKGYAQYIEQMAKKDGDKDAKVKEEKKRKDEIEWITIFCDYMSQHTLSPRVAAMGFGKLAKIYTKNIGQLPEENLSVKGTTEEKRGLEEWQFAVATLCINKMILNDKASEYVKKFRLIRNLVIVCEIHGKQLLALKLLEGLLAQTLSTETVFKDKDSKDKKRVALLRKITTFYHSFGNSAYNRNLHFEALGYWRQAENRYAESEKKTELNDTSTETHRSKAIQEQSEVFQSERKDPESKNKDKGEKDNSIDPKSEEIEDSRHTLSTPWARSISTEAHSAQLNALFHAILNNDLDKIRALVKQVDVNARAANLPHISPLHYAALHSHKDVVKDVINTLIDAGADPKLRVDGETPSDYAKANDRPDVAELIEHASLNENVQQTGSSNPTAVGIPHKTPSALFRKALSAKGKLSQQQLIETLPQDKTWNFGEAIDNGDCFYDAIAQSLDARAKNSTHTVKSLRKMCSDYLYQLNAQSSEANWVKEALEKGKEIDDYQTHLTSVQFTAEEMIDLKQENMFTGYAIWGKPHIEGKILAEKLNVSLHIIEFHEAEGGIEVSPAHILVTSDKVSLVEEKSINYQDKQLIHLAVYRNHFVPILPSQDLKQQQSNPEVCKQEMTQFNEHSRLNRLKSNKQEVVTEHRRNSASQGEATSQSSTEGEYEDSIIRELLEPLTSISNVVLPEQNYFCPFLPQEGAGSSQDECRNALQKALRDALEGKTTLIVLNTASSVDVSQPKHWTLCVVRPIQAANQITLYYIDAKGSVFDSLKKGIKKEENYEIQGIGSPGDHEAHLAGSASLWLQFLQKNPVLSKWEVEANNANHQATQATQSTKLSVRVVFTGKIQQSDNDSTGCGAYVVANAEDWVKEPQLETPKSYFIEALRQFHQWRLEKPRSNQEITHYLQKNPLVNVLSSKANRGAILINPFNFFVNLYNRSLSQTPPETKTAQHEVMKGKLPVMEFTNLYKYPKKAPFAIETVAHVLQNLDLLLEEVKKAGIGYFGEEHTIADDALKTAPATVLGVRRTLEMCLGQMAYLIDEVNTVVTQSPWTEMASSQKPGFDHYAKTLLGEYSEGKLIREGLISQISKSDLKKGKLPKPVLFLFKIPSSNNKNNEKETESWVVGAILPAKYKTWDEEELNNEEALLFYINPKDLTQRMPETLQIKLQEKISFKEVKAATKGSALMGSLKEAPDVPLEATSALWAMYCGLMILKTGTIEFLSKVLELSPPERPDLKGQKEQFVLTLHALFREVTMKSRFVTFEKRKGGSPEMISRVQKTRKDSFYHHFKIASHTLEPRSIKELAIDIKAMQEFWEENPSSRNSMGILISLDLSSNPIGRGYEITNPGVFPLAEALQQNTTLEVLILRDCQLDDEDVQALANALGQNQRLKYLDLSDNKITDRGGEILLRLLGENHTLEQIKVEGNPISFKIQWSIETTNRRPLWWLLSTPAKLQLKPTTEKAKKSGQSVATLEAIQFSLEAIRIGNVGIHVVDLELCRIKAEHEIPSLATNKDKQATQKVEQELNLDYSADKQQKNQKKDQQLKIKRELLRLVHQEDDGCLTKPLVMLVQAEIEIRSYSLLNSKVQKTTGAGIVVLPQKYVTLTGKALGNEAPLIFYLNPLSENSLLQKTIKTLLMEESWDEIKKDKDGIPQITPIKLPAVFPKEPKASQEMWKEVEFKIDQPGQQNPAWGYWMFYAVLGILSTGSTEFLDQFEANYANYEADLRRHYPQLGKQYPQFVKSLVKQGSISEETASEKITVKFSQEENARKFAEVLARLGLGNNVLKKSRSAPEYYVIFPRNDWNVLQSFIHGQKVERKKTQRSWEEIFNSLPPQLKPQSLFEEMKKLKEENTDLKKKVDSQVLIVGELKGKMTKLEEENGKLKEESENLKNLKQELEDKEKARITTLEEELKSTKEELQWAVNKLKDLEKKIVLQNNAVSTPKNNDLETHPSAVFGPSNASGAMVQGVTNNPNSGINSQLSVATHASNYWAQAQLIDFTPPVNSDSDIEDVLSTDNSTESTDDSTDSQSSIQNN